jgi:flagellar hook-associated protein 3 FlgL
MIRVTENMTFAALQRGLLTTEAKVFTAHQKAVSGYRVLKPSDDPIAAAQGDVFLAAQKRLGAMAQVSDHVSMQVDLAETAMGEATSLLQRARELTIAGTNGSHTANDRVDLAEEITRLREQMLETANKRDANGTYLFGGFLRSTPPFLATGAYVGDLNVRRVEIAPGVKLDANIPGSNIFAPAAGEDIFALLDGLEADLRANNPVAVGTYVGRIDVAMRQVSVARTEFGLTMQKIDKGYDTRTSTESNVVAARAAAVEITPYEAYPELARAQAALEAVLAQTSRVLDTLAQGSQI